MEKNHVSLEEAIIELRKWISGRTKLTCDKYELVFRQLKEEQNLHSDVDDEILVEIWYANKFHVSPFMKPQTHNEIVEAGVAFKLLNVLQGEEIHTRNNFRPAYLWYDALLANYVSWMDLNGKKPGTVSTRIGRIRIFFAYMDAKGIYQIGGLKLEDFAKFPGWIDAQNHYTSQGKHNILYTVRDFLKCPNVADSINCNPSPVFSRMHTKKHERLPSFYDADDVTKLINSIDKSTKIGKKSYAIILLAAVYGIRVVDIRTLHISSIHWSTNKICLVQKKTGRLLELPLLPEVKWAIADYLKNGRPTSEDPHVFIRERPPYHPYSPNNHLESLVDPYFKIAGIDTTGKHHGLHSLRHSLATKLSEMSIPLNDVATILGHSTANATLQYIWFDIAHLSVAAEEVPRYAK